RALRGATAPVIVYIPPGAELRGGAWAVVDPSNAHERRVQLASEGLDQGAAAATLRRWFTEDQGETRVGARETWGRCTGDQGVFYWRLKRLLRQNAHERRVQLASEGLDQGAAAATLRRWFTEDQGETRVGARETWVCSTGETRVGARETRACSTGETRVGARETRACSTGET
ncbi:Acetyl-CoA carboxylase, partial [Operophtera brumata]